MKSLRIFLIGLSRPTKQLIVVGVDSVGFVLSAIAVAWLLFGTDLTVDQISRISLITVVIALPLAWSQGLYRSVVRYMGFDLFVAGAKTAAGSAVVGAAFLFFAGIAGAPFRWAVAFWAMALIYICSSRSLARVFLIHTKSRSTRERVIIYGAGSAGAQLAISLFGGNEFLPVAMIDDDRTLHDKTVRGLVVHPPSALERIIRDNNATRVLMAMPSASRRRRRAAIERLSEFSVRVQTVPGITDLVSGKAQADDITDVDVEDLLGRDPVPPNDSLLGKSITGKNVIVTGAGGSIGSELCKQILDLNPARLVLLEISEAALYDIDRNLNKLARKIGSKCEVVALLGSVHHEQRVREIMKTFDIQTVYHAAAYKHVPIVEQNLLAGIYNNVFGTLHIARAAIELGVETFVLISTDKAVSPTSVMGATKRFAELILQAYNTQQHKTLLCMVRFGNVLESSGSVVPLFREQIRNGGPVTVTHRDIIRYFMTIPEAAQLVIQAAAMAKGGDVFVLDMGEPVKIHDLAHRMINLMGLKVRDKENPDGDIEILFTGLRPAEKLFEELLIGANVTGTEHPRIMRADEDFLPFDVLSALLDELKIVSLQFEHDRARDILLNAVKEYSPENGIDDLVWTRKNELPEAIGVDTVVDFPSRRN